jgi:hypothetical protein
LKLKTALLYSKSPEQRKSIRTPAFPQENRSYFTFRKQSFSRKKTKANPREQIPIAGIHRDFRILPSPRDFRDPPCATERAAGTISNASPHRALKILPAGIKQCADGDRLQRSKLIKITLIAKNYGI